MKKKITIIGLGKLFQIIHFNNIKKIFKIHECLDARNLLVKLVAKKFQINLSYQNFNELISLTKTKILFCFASRESSFYILKKMIPLKRKIFCEKPAVFCLEDAKKLNKLSIQNNCSVKIGFMSRYDKGVIFLKNFLNRELIKKDLIKAEFFLSNKKFYLKKYNFIRTNEDQDFNFANARYPKFIKKRDYINYHIFLNRYSHVINLINFFFSDVRPINFNIIDKFNYFAELSSNNIPITFKCENTKNYVFLIKIKTKKMNLECSLKNPTKDYFSTLKIKNNTGKIKILKFKNNIFNEEIKHFLLNKDYSKTDLFDLTQDIKLIEDLWKKY